MDSQDMTLIETPSDRRLTRAAAAGARARTHALPGQRLALGGMLALAALLNLWGLDRQGDSNTYYAAAVKSMLRSWHNFFFVSFDPGGFVSVDKPPLDLWLQAASAKLFGFSGVSLILPQAVAGILSVAVLYHLVARVWGPVAGLFAALALALTPISVVANRNNIVDGVLVLALLLGAWAATRAAETGRLRPLLLCAVFVGLGFNVKMLQAYLVVPAFGLLYLLAAPLGWGARIRRLALATALLLAVSFSWIAAVDLTPAAARPYVGSSCANSELDLALGYNGLGRLTGNIFSRGSCASATTQGAGGTGAPVGGFTANETGTAGPLRLFNAELGGQASWLLPLALLGLAVGAWRRRPALPLDREQGAVALWGVWLLTAAGFFSVAGFFHSYYLVMLAPPVAALAAIAVIGLWRAYRASGARGWALPLTLVGAAAVQVALLTPYPDWSRWLSPLVALVALVAAALLAAARSRPGLVTRMGSAATVAGALALLMTPASWAATSIQNGNGGLTPRAGPEPQRTGNAGGEFGAFAPPGAAGQGGRGQDFGERVDAKTLRYLRARQGRTTYLVATLNATAAAPYILATGQPVMALGGFLGSDRIVTPERLRALVAGGTVRYILAPATGGAGAIPPAGLLAQLPAALRARIEARLKQGGAGGIAGIAGGNGDLITWVTKNCATVPSSDYQTTTVSANGSSGGFSFGGGQQLYDCTRDPSSTTNPSSPPSSSGRQAPTRSGGTTTIGRPALIGQWAPAARGTVTVQSFNGARSLPTTDRTRYYEATGAAWSALATGQRVAVSLGAGSASTAASVAIAPPAAPTSPCKPLADRAALRLRAVDRVAWVVLVARRRVARGLRS